MGSAFASAIEGMFGAVDDFAGELVTYKRGGAVLVAGLTATPGQAVNRTTEALDVPIAANARDWMFNAAKLVSGGAATLPQSGDQIVDAAGRIFEVTTDGDQVYRWSDRGRTRLRVHTKEMTAQ